MDDDEASGGASASCGGAMSLTLTSSCDHEHDDAPTSAASLDDASMLGAATSEEYGAGSEDAALVDDGSGAAPMDVRSGRVEAAAAAAATVAVAGVAAGAADVADGQRDGVLAIAAGAAVDAAAGAISHNERLLLSPLVKPMSLFSASRSKYSAPHTRAADSAHQNSSPVTSLASTPDAFSFSATAASTTIANRSLAEAMKP